MNIRTKGIYFDRFEDAPFVGCLLSSIGCSKNCVDCHNQHLRSQKIQVIDCDDLINKIKSNKFCQGIILGGLEWTEQPAEMEALIVKSLENDLQVMLYTGLNEKDFSKTFAHLLDYKIYIKFGEYIASKRVDNYRSYGVKLASSNQYIKYANEMEK